METINTEEMKKCARCKADKSLAYFAMTTAKGKPRRHSYCGDCVREYSKECKDRTKAKIDATVTSKKCTNCNVEKTVGEFTMTFYGNWYTDDCTECRRRPGLAKRDAKRFEKKKVRCATIQEKTCNKCAIVKSIGNFTKSVQSSDGYIHTCKQCESDRRKLESKENIVNRNLGFIKTPNEKRCPTCKTVQSADGFPKDISKKDGLGGQCKACIKKYRLNNADKIKAARKEWYWSDVEAIRKKNREGWIVRKEKEITKEYVKRYNQENRTAIRQRTKDHVKKARESGMCASHTGTPAFRKGACFDCVMHDRLRKAHKRALESIKNKRKSRYNEVLGCTVPEFAKYLESLWEPGMNWENYGRKNGERTWEIDHKKPLVMGATVEEINELCHYTNTRPMWREENHAKSSWFDGKFQRKNRL